MDRINRYLDVVPLPVLLSVPMVAILGFFFVFFILPRKLHLDVALFGMMIWFVLGRLPDLGMVQTITKATEFVVLIAVGAAAYTAPGPKRRLPMLVWAYPLLGLLSYVYVVTCVDVGTALVLRTQWVMMTVAGILVARTIVDEASLHRVLYAVGLGVLVAMLAPLSDLLLHPGDAMNKGLGRFEPYGANSNQIGVLFSLAAPLGLYLGFHTRRAILKPMFFAGSAAALGMGLLTGSRSTLVTMVVPAIPVLIVMCRKPMMAMVAGGMGLVILAFVVAQAEGNTAFDRYESLQTARVQLFKDYVRESVAQRPLFGLLGTSGMSYFREEDLQHHAHNAYLEATYMGGLSYAIPLLVMVGVTQLAAAHLFIHRKNLGADPLTISFLVALMFTIYAQGFVNEVIYYPTYEWAMLHVMLSCLMMSMAADARAGIAPLTLPVWTDEEWDGTYAEDGDPDEGAWPDERGAYS